MSFDPVKFYREFPGGGNNERGDWLTRCLTQMCAEAAKTVPLDMLLFCPRCELQHVDAPKGDWTNPPHATHTCQGCGLLWRPSNGLTNGVSGLSSGEAKHVERFMATDPRIYAPSTTRRMTGIFESATPGSYYINFSDDSRERFSTFLDLACWLLRAFTPSATLCIPERNTEEYHDLLWHIAGCPQGSWDEDELDNMVQRVRAGLNARADGGKQTNG